MSPKPKETRLSPAYLALLAEAADGLLISGVADPGHQRLKHANVLVQLGLLREDVAGPRPGQRLFRLTRTGLSLVRGA